MAERGRAPIAAESTCLRKRCCSPLLLASGQRCSSHQVQSSASVPVRSLRRRRKAVAGPLHEAATPASLDLQLVCERLRLSLGGGLDRFAPPLRGRGRPLRVPDGAPFEHARHELRASVPLTYHRTLARHLTARVSVQFGGNEAKTPTHSARATQLAALRGLVDPRCRAREERRGLADSPEPVHRQGHRSGLAVWSWRRRTGCGGRCVLSPRFDPALWSRSTLALDWAAHASGPAPGSLGLLLRSAAFAPCRDGRLGNHLPVARVEKRVEVVLARDLHVLHVLLERLGHRRRKAREEVDLQCFLNRAHIGQAALSSLLPCSVEKRGGETEGRRFAFGGRWLCHRSCTPFCMYC